MRRTAAMPLALLAALLLGGCGADEPAPGASTPGPLGDTHGPAPAPTAAGGGPGSAAGIFAPYGSGAGGISYDPELLPAGATASLEITPAAAGTRVLLAVTGLVPNRPYGAHLHTRPCGETGAAAGPHYQHRADPHATASPPSADPAYANPANEVWLDFTTDATGGASATATQSWAFPPGAGPRSLVIHAEPTRTAAGEAGAAGARLGCLTLPE